MAILIDGEVVTAPTSADPLGVNQLERRAVARPYASGAIASLTNRNSSTSVRAMDRRQVRAGIGFTFQRIYATKVGIEK